MHKCPRFFSDCKSNTKARSWPTMSTTTIVSCSTSLHRHFLDMSRHSIRVKTTSHTASPLPDLKPTSYHLMSGHFQWSKTKKMIQSEIHPTWFFSMLFMAVYHESSWISPTFGCSPSSQRLHVAVVDELLRVGHGELHQPHGREDAAERRRHAQTHAQTNAHGHAKADT